MGSAGMLSVIARKIQQFGGLPILAESFICLTDPLGSSWGTVAGSCTPSCGICAAFSRNPTEFANRVGDAFTN